MCLAFEHFEKCYMYRLFSFFLFFSINIFAFSQLPADSICNDSLHIDLVQEVDTQFVANLDSLIEEYEKIDMVNKAIYNYEDVLMKKETNFDWNSTTTLIKGGLLTLTNDRFRERNAIFQHHHSSKIDYLPAAAPLIATWTLKGLGLESRSKIKRITMANALALGIGVSTSQLLKHSLNEKRPNGKDEHSLPSGHATIAFISATILDREYGHYSPWISIAGYSAALATQFHRIHQNAHYLNDVIVGAGLGIVSTNLAYYITDLFWGEKEINKPIVTKSDINKFFKFLNRPTSFALYTNTETGYNLIKHSNFTVLNNTDHNLMLRSTSSLGTALELSYFFNQNIAIEAAARLTQTKVQVVDNSSFQPTIYGNNIYQYHLNLGVKYSLLVGLEQRVGFRTFAGYRYIPEADFYGIESDTPEIVIKRDNNFECGAGINIDFLSYKKYISGISCDYTHSFSPLFKNRWVLGSYFKILL